MGGCATKPRVLKDAGAGAGAPMPEPQKEESGKDLTAVKEGAGADEEANKRRSLSNLFKESEEKSLEDGKDETYETEQASDLSASNPKETKKPKCAEEQTPPPVVDNAPAKTEAQKTQEVASTAEVPKLETPCEEEKIEDVKPTTEGKKDETPETRTEEKPTEDSQKSETPVEEKTEEKHPEKKTEEAPATPQIEDKKPPSTLEKTMEN